MSTWTQKGNDMRKCAQDFDVSHGKLRSRLISLIAGILGPFSAQVPSPEAAELVQVEYAQYRVGEASGSVSVAVIRGPDSAQAATVDFVTVAQTATPDVDFTATEGTLAFGPGEELKLITIPILNDTLKESLERFQIRLTHVTGSSLGAHVAAAVSIVDNDSGVRFTTGQVWVHEDQAGIELSVMRGSDTPGSFTVDYVFTDLTARAGEDYHHTNGTLHFASGDTSRTIWIPIVNDYSAEANERFQVQLTNLNAGHTLAALSKTLVNIVDATGMEPAQISGGRQLSDGSVQLTISGGVPERFRDYHRIFSAEASADLQTWDTLPLLGAPSSLATQPVLTFAEDQPMGQRFARVVATPMICPDPPPTGPYRVGLTRREIMDPTRRNRYLLSTNAAFPVNIWYPALPVAGRLPAAFLETELLVVESGVFLDLMDRESRFSSYSTRDLPLAPHSGSGWPVVLFSHGANSFRIQAQAICQNLASHGFVVVAPDHFDAFKVLLNSGEVYVSSTTASVTVSNSQDRVRDLTVVLNSLSEMNQEDALLRLGLNVSQVGAMGFSWGALTAAEFCRTDTRCRAVLSLDWGSDSAWTFSDLLRLGLDKPSLMLNASDNTADALYGKGEQDAFWIQISNTTHGDFILAPWLNNNINTTSLETGRTVQAYVVSFFAKYLTDKDDHLLDGPSAAFPRVSSFRKK